MDLKKRTTVTLANSEDAYNFHVGRRVTFEPIYGSIQTLRLPESGNRESYRPHETVGIIGYREVPEWKLYAHRFWRRLTNPFRRHQYVSAVDCEAGTVTAESAPKRWWKFLGP